MKKCYTFAEVCGLIDLPHATVVEMIERQWIRPEREGELDEEDLARLRLIKDLRLGFGANDEAIPLILHLLDQLCHLRNQMSRFRSYNR